MTLNKVESIEIENMGGIPVLILHLYWTEFGRTVRLTLTDELIERLQTLSHEALAGKE